jgi:aminoglycoside phosphotransferase (APT) family kinase protein
VTAPRLAPTTVSDPSPFGIDEPPPRDHDLTPEIVRRVLGEQFPRLALASVRHLGSGWERDAYLVDRRLVVHFPRHAGVADGLDRHLAILTHLDASAGAVVRVPRTTMRGAPGAHYPHRFFGHPLIPGVGSDEISAPAPPALAAELGRALSAVHALPGTLAGGHALAAADDDAESAYRALAAQAARVDGLADAAPGAAAWLAAGPAIPPSCAGPPRFLHADLSAEHVLVVPGSGRLAGVIDWSGAAMGDPSLDFSHLLLSHGRAFLHAALAEYRLPLDGAFLERTAFRARVRAIGWLVDALRRGADPARGARAVANAFGG